MKYLAILLLLLIPTAAGAQSLTLGGGGTTVTWSGLTDSGVPATDNNINWGSATKRYIAMYSLSFSSGTGSAMTLTADVANSGSNAAFSFNNTTALTGSTLIARFGTNGSYKVNVEDNGAFVPTADGASNLGASATKWGTGHFYTVNAIQNFNVGRLDGSGTPGAITNNTSLGCFAFAAGTGAAGIVITNDRVAATGLVLPVLQSNDSTCKSVGATPAAGSFTAFTNANCTATAKVCYLLVGAGS